MPPELIDTATGTRSPICVDCGEAFAPTADEVAARRRRAMPPATRCPACRERRLAERNERLLASYASGPSGSRQRPAAGPEAGSGALHPATCAACGRGIRVPFRPRPDRPVYCRACFDARHGR